MSLDRDAVDFLARERGIHPAFIEKDWHAVRVLHAIASHSCGGLSAIFSGGTSLSKGYGLIQRFSEDLDFRIRVDGGEYSANQLKKLRHSFRESLLTVLSEMEGITFDASSISVSGLGFRLLLSYAREYEAPGGMRPDLQIDFSYSPAVLSPSYRPISSFVSQYKSSPPETGILCLSPIEIAADKFSGLTWRVLKRDRDADDDDPAMVRHLHDLCALHRLIEQDLPLVRSTAESSFNRDQTLAGRMVEVSLLEAASLALTKVITDTQYRLEYEEFVDAFSYADDSDAIHFDAAVEAFRFIIELIGTANP
jgi:predicted nucleotidyltransferase component of viral defense system